MKPCLPSWLRILPAVWLLLLLHQTSVAASLLSNPGFELDGAGGTQNLPGWSLYGPYAYTESSTAIAHSGSNYFKVYQAFTGTVNYTGIYQDYLSGAGAVYAADGWAYTAGSDTIAGQNVAWIEITFRDANANVLALYRSAIQPAMTEWGASLGGAASVPGLSIAAPDDPFAGSKDLAGPVAEQLGARTAVLPGQGHWWMLGDPDGGAAVLEDFWASL